MPCHATEASSTNLMPGARKSASWPGAGSRCGSCWRFTAPRWDGMGVGGPRGWTLVGYWFIGWKLENEIFGAFWSLKSWWPLADYCQNSSSLWVRWYCNDLIHTFDIPKLPLPSERPLFRGELKAVMPHFRASVHTTHDVPRISDERALQGEERGSAEMMFADGYPQADGL